MSNRKLLALICLAVAGWFAFESLNPPHKPCPQPPDEPCPIPAPDDRRRPRPKPPAPPRRPQPKPWDMLLPAPVGASVGGSRHPDGTEVDCDLPEVLHKKNIASSGLGCCVFRSLDHAARWQNEPALWGMPEWMVQSRIKGGGYPSKVAELVPKIAKSRGLPTPPFIQVEGMDLEPLKAASRSGRMISVTYSKSPTGRYGGSRIAHMVNLVHCDDKHVVVLDNNYIGANALEWMTPEEFKRAYAPGWAVILLAPPPPPPPRSQP
jgi:hypothetical protein